MACIPPPGVVKDFGYILIKRSNMERTRSKKYRLLNRALAWIKKRGKLR